MDLKDIRMDINRIDDSMKELFDERLKCSENVAMVKMAKGDEVFKPDREREICERFSASGENDYLVFVKKIMQISRRYQYRMFVNAGIVDADFDKWLGNGKAVFENGGIFDITVKADSDSVKALNVNDILSVVADSGLEIKELETDGESNKVHISLAVDNTDKSKRDAYVLAYLLYKETITNNFD